MLYLCNVLRRNNEQKLRTHSLTRYYYSLTEKVEVSWYVVKYNK